MSYQWISNMETPEEKKEYRELNKTQILKKRKEWEKENPNSGKERTKKWRERNPEKAKKNCDISVKKRKLVDEIFRLKCNVRSMISKLISRNGYSKKNKTNEILGCTFEDFKQHLESKFESWMNWSNYGKYNGEFNYGWDVDHITPMATAKTENDVITLNNYTNLQPLCSKVNRDVKRNFTKITLELSMDF